MPRGSRLLMLLSVGIDVGVGAHLFFHYDWGRTLLAGGVAGVLRALLASFAFGRSFWQTGATETDGVLHELDFGALLVLSPLVGGGVVLIGTALGRFVGFV